MASNEAGAAADAMPVQPAQGFMAGSFTVR
jgi:hypothetical protein